MSFKEIIGQDSAISFLKTAYRRKRLAHAYVFFGPGGIGKKKTALNFAKLLVCQDPQGEEPCDGCASCVKADGFIHPDIQWVAPEGQFIKIDSIREARRSLNLKSFESGAKVLIVDDAQCLNEESSNALLKTLEEPAPQTVIILIADTLRSILPTISSRCQRIVFLSLPEHVVRTILLERFGISEEAAFFLARLCQGHLGAAIRYQENGLFQRKNQIIKNAFDRNCPVQKFIELAAKDRSERNTAVQEALCVLSGWLRDLLLAKCLSDPVDLINEDRREDILRLCRQISVPEINDRLSAIAETARELERNINPRISLAKLKVALWR